MLRILLFIPLFALLNLSSYSQLNMTELGYLDIPDMHGLKLNDIWGYVDEEGNEYALVGAQNGLSIVDVTDPTNPTEIKWFWGSESIWRDIKTVGDYAYVTTEAEAGLWIIDLSPLPESTDLPISTYSGPEGNEWYTAHNLYADDGFVYIFGAGRDNGGTIILDVTTDPMNPIEVGVFDNWYVHDGYVRDNVGYFGHIYEGFFSIVDLTDKSAPVLISTLESPTYFTHNIWISDDSDYAFTTDEVSGGYLGAFDISDPTSPVQIDKIQSSPGEGVVPHNAHVWGDYLVTSYYTDGVVIHDISQPHNMVEVAHFDTSPLATTSTDGCWGVYPYFPSGNMIASDREEGLFVLSADLHQGSYLEGNVTEEGTGFAVNNVEITIDGTTVEDVSDVLGDYAIGIEEEGSFDVNFFKVLYFPKTITVDFVNGEIVTEDVVLEKIPQYSVTVRVVDAETFNPIEGAQVLLEHTYINSTGVTDALGEADLEMYYEDNYQLFAGKWGYQSGCFVDTLITDATGTIIVPIQKGYYDDFNLDFGWTTAGSAEKGHWEREIPVGASGGDGDLQNPDKDAPWDCGGYAFLTGNGSSASNDEEVEKGEVVLISPEFDLTPFLEPHINFFAWFYNKHGSPPDDTMKVYVSNGTENALLTQFYAGETELSKWNPVSVPVPSSLALTETMQLIVTLSDYETSVNVTEGGIDHFSITDFSLVDLTEEKSPESITIYPNPFKDVLMLNGAEKGTLELYDLTGKEVFKTEVAQSVSIDHLEKGLYIIVLKDEEELPYFSQKLLKE